MKVRTLDSRQPTFDAQFAELVAVDTAIDREIDRVAAAIVDEVRTRGDAALLEYTNRFDRMRASSVAELEIPAAEMQAALDALPNDQRVALETAARRIRAYHERQVATTWTYTEDDGTELGQRVNALDSVGLYVPGGLAAYPSSLLMNALPAHVAGVENIVMVVPTPDGRRNPLVLAAAALAGVSRAFAIGGAQAVAALAYGTETVPAVDKIVGPGNAYVAAAKRRVFGVVGIDMIAGPSEILVICDGRTDPDWIAMDLFSQAEHDELAQSILLTPDAGLHRTGAGVDREAAADDAAARDHRAVARKPRRADPDARPRRSLRDRRPHRARAPRDLDRRARSGGPRRSGTRARCSSVATPAKRSATTAPGPTTCCRPRARRASPRRWASTTSRSAPA